MEDNIKSEEKHVITAGVAEESVGALQNGSPQPVKRGRGRPLGSVSKRPKPVKVPGKRGRPRKPVEPSAQVNTTPKKRGRPFKVIKQRGRPRKVPLTAEEEEERKKLKDKPKRPRVWKPLGRPRIYPRVETTPPPKSRGRGRPRKSESKQGAHLRKTELSPTVKSPRVSSVDGLPLKRGRPRGSTKRKDKQFPSANKFESDTEQGETSLPPSKRFCRKSTNMEDESPFSQVREKAAEVLPKHEMGKSQSKHGTRFQPSSQSTGGVPGEEGASYACSQSKNENRVSGSVAEGRAGESGKTTKKIANRKCVTDKMAASGRGSRHGNLDREKTQRGRRAKKGSSL